MHGLFGGAVAFGCALYLTLTTKLGSTLSPMALLPATLGAFLLALFPKSAGWRRVGMVVFLLCLGLLNGLRVGPSAAEQLQHYFDKEVLVWGRVEPLSIKQKGNFTSVLLQCEALSARKQVRRLEQQGKAEQGGGGEALQLGEQVLPYTGRLRMSLPSSVKLESLPSGGSTMLVQGRLVPLHSLRNPGSFDGDTYNRVNNIGGRLQKTRLLQVGIGPAPNASPQTGEAVAGLLSWRYWQERLAWWNLELRQSLQKTMGEGDGALLAGMLLGGSGVGTTEMEEAKEIFAANGLSHLLSVSGTHLVLLAGLLTVFLRPLVGRRYKFCLVLVLMLYACLCGLRPPVVRALAMSSVLLLGSREQQKPGISKQQADRGTLLCLVAIVLLLCKPLWLLDLGFQLSFAATAGLIWLLPSCQRLLPQALPEFLSESLAVTMAAQLATLPLLVANFHQLSLISLLSNVLLVPVLELVALGGVLATALASSSVTLLVAGGQELAKVASFFLDQLLLQGELLTHLPYSQLVMGSQPAWCSVLYYALLLLWADLPWVQFWQQRQRQLLLALMSTLLVGTMLWQSYGPGKLTAYFLDVGQGDCVVIVSPQGQVFVYDTGGLPSLDTGKQVVAPFLRSLGKRRVDVLCLSHYDFDHVGGAVGLMKQMEVKQVLLPREALEPGNLQLYEVISQTALERGCSIRLVEPGEHWSLGGGVAVSFNTAIALEHQDLKLTSTVEDAEAPSGNAASTVAAVASPWGSLLLTGDLGSAEEEVLLMGHFDVFKAGHHGSKNSNSASFLQRLQPRLTVISCGYRNPYNHPHPEALARLREVGSAVLRTDLQGNVRLIFDESGIKCYSYIHNNYELTSVISKKE